MKSLDEIPGWMKSQASWMKSLDEMRSLLDGGLLDATPKLPLQE